MRLARLFWHPLVSLLVCEAILYEIHDSPPAAMGPCDGLSPDVCGSMIGCFYANDFCAPRIAWLHIMKTASSFGTVLAHFANRSLPADAHIPSGVHKNDPEDRAARAVDNKNKHLVFDFFEYKYPVNKWFKDIFRLPRNPGDHVPIMNNEWDDFKGYWVTVLRQPEERVSSAFHHFAQGKGDILGFQRAVQGQQVSMMSLGNDAKPRIECERSGGGQNGPAPQCEGLARPDVWKALSRMREFQFIGILEEYDLSVCLFHVMYRSDCLPVEFGNIRPTKYHESEEKKQKELEQLKQHPDPWDTPLYEAAVQRFRGDLAQFNVNEERCRTICPGSPFDKKDRDASSI
eukprot:TRINITY_DN1609_c0_g1_i2.p1 TRINITY_DN1609_c0_g1~~TRINITY_DN1609_c0_g1_i2.p1  ORF type:complete len:345 (+),score=50.53 TRINITY_DN1609_c0_g1_i2:62-1096(+)